MLLIERRLLFPDLRSAIYTPPLGTAGAYLVEILEPRAAGRKRTIVETVRI